MDHVDRARNDLERAHEATDGEVQEQLASLEQALSDGGEREDAQTGGGQIEEITSKLDGLADEIETEDTAGKDVDTASATAHVESAREHLREFLNERSMRNDSEENPRWSDP